MITSTEERFVAPASQTKVEDFYPLSPMQEGLLFQSLLSRETGAYVTQHSYVVEQLDAERFRLAWQKAVDRHTILRTAFVWKTSPKPLQAVFSHVQVPFEQEDWSLLSAEEQQSRTKEYMLKDRNRGFDFNRAPLLRIAVIRLSGALSRVFLSNHHLLLDGWSLPLLFREVSQIYAGLSANQAVDLPPVRPFRDYICWLVQKDREETKAYWRRIISGFASPTKIGIKPAQNASDAACFEERELQFTAENSAQLRLWAQNRGLTLSSVIAGMWAVVLGHISRTSEVLFGMVVSGRPAELSQVESMLGIFINTLPVRIKLPAGEMVVAWLQQLQSAQAEMRNHEFISLAEIQKWSDVPHGEKLFDCIFDFLNYPAAAGQATSEPSGPYQAIYSNSNSYPLQFVIEARGNIFFRFTYNRAVVEISVVARMLLLLQTAIEALVKQENLRVEELRRVIQNADRKREWQDRSHLAAPKAHRLGFNPHLASTR